MTVLLQPIEVIPRVSAFAFVQEHHYSAVLPRLTKHCLASRDNYGKIGAVCTLGWGVRPAHTIRLAFPGLTPADYLEIGKLCLRDELPRNSESYFLSLVVRWLRSHRSELKVLWTWADGILGKPGYVYQAANFWYGGYIETETYVDAQGRKVHPRTMQGLTAPKEGGRGSRARTITEALGYSKVWGRQFRYCYPLCRPRQWETLVASSPFEWRRNCYPKDADCVWRVCGSGGEWNVETSPVQCAGYVRRETAGQLQLGIDA